MLSLAGNQPLCSLHSNERPGKAQAQNNNGRDGPQNGSARNRRLFRRMGQK
jgi:hypothetical protein